MTSSLSPEKTRRSVLTPAMIGCSFGCGVPAVLKGSRYLLLKGLDKLKPSSLEHLALLMELSQPLYQAYLLKEELRCCCSLPNEAAGEDFLDGWTTQRRHPRFLDQRQKDATGLQGPGEDRALAIPRWSAHQRPRQDPLRRRWADPRRAS